MKDYGVLKYYDCNLAKKKEQRKDNQWLEWIITDSGVSPMPNSAGHLEQKEQLYDYDGYIAPVEIQKNCHFLSPAEVALLNWEPTFHGIELKRRQAHNINQSSAWVTWSLMLPGLCTVEDFKKRCGSAQSLTKRGLASAPLSSSPLKSLSCSTLEFSSLELRRRRRLVEPTSIEPIRSVNQSQHWWKGFSDHLPLHCLNFSNTVQGFPHPTEDHLRKFAGVPLPILSHEFGPDNLRNRLHLESPSNRTANNRRLQEQVDISPSKLSSPGRLQRVYHKLLCPNLKSWPSSSSSGFTSEPWHLRMTVR